MAHENGNNAGDVWRIEMVIRRMSVVHRNDTEADDVWRIDMIMRRMTCSALK